MRLSLKTGLIVTHDTILTFGISEGRSIIATVPSILQAVVITETKKSFD